MFRCTYLITTSAEPRLCDEEAHYIIDGASRCHAHTLSGELQRLRALGLVSS